LVSVGVAISREELFSSLSIDARYHRARPVENGTAR
jgi:hypothetical protein